MWNFLGEEFCSVQLGSLGDLGTTSVGPRAACESMHRHMVAVGLGNSLFGGCLQEKWYFGEEIIFFVLQSESHQNLFILLLEFSESLVIKIRKQIKLLQVLNPNKRIHR